MPNLRAIVTMPFISGKPEDVAVNVLHFSSASSDDAAAEVIKGHVNTLFNTAPPNGPSGNAATAISGYLSNALSRVANACTVKVYDLADPLPRLPRVKTWTLAASNNTAGNEMPAEVAVAVSIFAERSVPRQRGRIYFGPFHIGATEDDPTTQRARVGVIMRESLGGAVKRLIQTTANTQNLGVYSRGLYTVNGVPQAPVPGIMRVATGGWVDDAFDTQRRRGQEAVTRYSF